MTIERPTGAYAERMLEPGGWAEADEQTHYDRANAYTSVLQQVTEVLETTQHQQGEVFAGGIWSGTAATAANGALGTNINQMRTLQDYLVKVITWHKSVGEMLVAAKSEIGNNVDGAQREIMILETDPELEEEARTAAINSLVNATHAANVSVTSGTAGQVLESKSWTPPHNALRDLLEQKSPPPPALPTVTLQTPNSPEVPITPRPDTPSIPMPDSPVLPGTPVTPVVPTPANPVTPGTPGVPLPPSIPTTPVSPTTPVTPVRPVTPVNPAPVTPTPVPKPTPTSPDVRPTPGPSPQPGPSPSQPGMPAGPGTHQPSTPGAPGDQPVHVKPAATVLDQPSVGGPAGQPAHPGSRADDPSSVGMMPAAATGMPAGGRASSGGSVGSASAAPQGSGSASSQAAGAGSRAGAGRAPLGKAPVAPASSSSSSMRPAAARPTPAAHPHDSRDGDTPASDTVTSFQVPVSKARAARDAMAAASSGRKKDPLRLARRVAAALNAPDSGSAGFGFFWITGLTTDGQIVVANSYGLAYIPEGVELPAKVTMASADDATPAAERARAATYPVMAVQGWAAQHDKKLRAVIGTAEQLANSDPGTTKVILEPDDIPESGKMTGRSRLAAVDADAAARLTDTADGKLTDLLPPAPAAEKAPEDRLHVLWFDAMKPMMSTAAGREAAHLRAFHAYADHAKELALHQAYGAADAQAQRPAVAEWLYWQYVTGLLDTALAAAS
jgi:hypothetical protein